MPRLGRIRRLFLQRGADNAGDGLVSIAGAPSSSTTRADQGRDIRSKEHHAPMDFKKTAAALMALEVLPEPEPELTPEEKIEANIKAIGDDIWRRNNIPQARAARAEKEGRPKLRRDSPEALAAKAAAEAERETVRAAARLRETARDAAIAAAYAEAPAPVAVRRAGKVVRGVFYRGAKRDRSNDPAYNLHTPRLIDRAVKEQIVSPADGYYATAIYRHIRRTERFSEATRRLTIAELARLVNRSLTVTRDAVKRLIAAGFLIVVKPGGGRGVGAIYALKAR
jgi:hypothetical protein